MHHIISDGWSLHVLQREFLQGYQALSTRQPLPWNEQPYQYTDYTLWHNRFLADLNRENTPAHRFWREKLANGFPLVQLPADYSEGIESAAGAEYHCMIPRELKEQLLSVAKDHSTSLFTVMFSLYLLLLSGVTNQEEVGCSIIAAGREHSSLLDIVGPLVNSILFQTVILRSESFDTYLQRIDEEMMMCLQYQGYPLEPVFQSLNQRFPQVTVSFNMLNMQDISGQQHLQPFEPYHIPGSQDIKFDLEPYISEYADGIAMRWVYRKAKFEPATIEYIIDRYIKMLTFYVLNPQKTLAQLPTTTTASKTQEIKKKFKKR